jgi:hypothetical protein
MSHTTPRRVRLAGHAAAVALAVGAIGAGVAGTAHADNGATFHPVMVDCPSTDFYRNYNPATDDFSDPDGTYHYGDVVSIRTGDERSGPRGVRGYTNAWGWFSRNCLQGYH